MNNLAIRMQYIGMMALVEDQIVDCFHGGGISYDAFPRFHALMAEESGVVQDATLLAAARLGKQALRWQDLPGRSSGQDCARPYCRWLEPPA